MIFGMSYLELSANLITALCIVLAGRNNVHTWWTGIVACVLFGILFYQSQLYADVTLQVFFVATGIIGWHNWLVKTKGVVNEVPTSVVGNTMTYMVGVAVVVAIVYGWLLHRFTNAYAPWIDSTVLTFSIVGQLTLMKRNVQTWPTWLLVNTLSVPLYYSRGLYVTAALYAFFWINAFVSWRHWSNLMRAVIVTTAPTVKLTRIAATPAEPEHFAA